MGAAGCDTTFVEVPVCQNEEAWVHEQSPCEVNPLPPATRKTEASLSDNRAVALWKRLNELVSLGYRAAFSTASSAAFGLPKAMSSRTEPENRRFSGSYAPDLSLERRERYVPHVAAAELYAAFRYVVEAGMRLTSTDLPEPAGPRTVTVGPGSMWKLTSRKT